MQTSLMRRMALVIIVLAGCSSTTKRPPDPGPVVGRGTPATPKPLAIDDRPVAPRQQAYDVDDRTLLIPPPPTLEEMTAKPGAVVMGSEPAQSASDDGTVKPANIVTTTGPAANDTDVERVRATNVNPVNLPSDNRQVEQMPPAKPADEALGTMKKIHQRAVAAYNIPAMDAFVSRLTRREAVNGQMNPEEVISFTFRKHPYSVRLKWLGKEGQGREVVYVQGKYGNKMNVMPSKDDAFPLPPMRMAFAPDDPMVRAKARHDIRDAGFSEAIRHLGDMLTAINRNPAMRNRLRYLGGVQRNEFPSKLDGIEETIPPRTEALLAQGGKRYTFFDTAANAKSFGLPVLVITYDASNKEVEYYRFDNFMYPYKVSDADFDPERIWARR
jgi:hypothetical protein